MTWSISICIFRKKVKRMHLKIFKIFLLVPKFGNDGPSMIELILSRKISKTSDYFRVYECLL